MPRLAEDAALQQECLDYVRIPRQWHCRVHCTCALLRGSLSRPHPCRLTAPLSPVARSPGRPAPDATTVMSMYFDLVPTEPALTLQAFCEKHMPTAAGVDVQRFIHYGRIRNLIRQVRMVLLVRG